MPVTTRTTTITEAEIREAIVEWLAAQNAGEGPQVGNDDIIFASYEDTRPIEFCLIAIVDH
jgi:hypothetical protein